MTLRELELKIFAERGLNPNKYRQVLKHDGFEFDGYSEPNIFNEVIPMLRTSAGLTLPLEDVILLDAEEFKEKYKGIPERETFTRYRSRYILLAGKDAITYYQNMIKEEENKYKILEKLGDEDISCGGY